MTENLLEYIIMLISISRAVAEGAKEVRRKNLDQSFILAPTICET